MDFTEAFRHTCSSVGVAARNGDLASLKTLLQNGASVDVHDNRGWNPIHEAAWHNHHICLTELLNTDFCMENKSFINSITFEEETAIVLAARHGHVESVKILLEHGADLLNITHEGIPFGAIRQGYTALWEAVCSKNVQCVKLLLEAESTESEDETKVPQAQKVINRQTYNGETPLHSAVENGLCEMTSLLLEHGARLDLYDDNHISPIFVAAQKGYLNCLSILIEAAVRQGLSLLINEPACDKATPLHLAAEKGNTSCLKLLLENGADPNLKAENPATLPLHAALQSRSYGCMEQLIPVTSPSAIKDCEVSLLEAVMPHMDLKCFQIMIKHGMNLTEDVDSISNLGVEYYPLSIVMPCIDLPPLSYKHLSLLGLCVSVDDNVFKREGDRCELVQFLLEAGLSPDPQTVNEAPPIVAAVYNYDLQCLELMLEHGADVHIKHPDFMGDIAVTCSAGQLPPSFCLLLLFLHGASPDSCFGWPSKADNSDFDIYFPELQFSIQELLLTYPDRNPWMHATRLKYVISLCWNPQLHPELEGVINNTEKWKQLKCLAAECSTLAHLCRRQIFKTLATRKAYRPETLSSDELPDTLRDYLFSSTVGVCYQELAESLEEERKKSFRNRHNLDSPPPS